ncbi:MAG: hypothetical protein J5968_00090 [Oscillospiraceae bacterium]|nr:hypothetical protein [Oscillospiraceae bacterium]
MKIKVLSSVISIIFILSQNFIWDAISLVYPTQGGPFFYPFFQIIFAVMYTICTILFTSNCEVFDEYFQRCLPAKKLVEKICRYASGFIIGFVRVALGVMECIAPNGVIFGSERLEKEVEKALEAYNTLPLVIRIIMPIYLALFIIMILVNIGIISGQYVVLVQSAVNMCVAAIGFPFVLVSIKQYANFKS